MKNIRQLAVANFIAFMIHVCVSYASQFKLISAKDVGEVSDTYPSLFTPAGFTFSIWGVIYLSLFAMTIYHIVNTGHKSGRDEATDDVRKMGAWFIINNLATAAWTIAWTAEQLLLSVVLILIQLISLISIHRSLNIYDLSRNGVSKAFTQFPLSIYLGWISIATIANISGYLASLGWTGGLDPETWTVIMISVAVLLSAAVVFTRRNIFYGLVVIWALYGILSKRNDPAGDDRPIVYAAWCALIVTAVICAIQMLRNSMLSRQMDLNTGSGTIKHQL
jgi:hypothetical protein